MDVKGEIARKRFAWGAWALLALNVPVILWGAYVRVSYSGDGCGAHWPFCNGQVLPQQMSKPTIIEFTHRMMTSVDTVGMIALMASAFLLFPKRHAVRRYATASFVFLLIEAALGAGLVIFRKVAHDQSAGRVWYLSGHLTNTMLLLAVMTITAWLATTQTFRLRLSSASPVLWWAAAMALIVSVTGALAALGDTLFPAASLAEGMQRDFASGSPVLLRLRMLHPAMALLGAAFIIGAAYASTRSQQNSGVRTASVRVIWLVIFQLFWGVLNLTLLAPLWMQLSHLLVADCVWVAIVVMIVESATDRDLADGSLEMTAQILSRQTALREPAER